MFHWNSIPKTPALSWLIRLVADGVFSTVDVVQIGALSSKFQSRVYSHVNDATSPLRTILLPSIWEAPSNYHRRTYYITSVWEYRVTVTRYQGVARFFILGPWTLQSINLQLFCLSWIVLQFLEVFSLTIGGPRILGSPLATPLHVAVIIYARCSDDSEKAGNATWKIPQNAYAVLPVEGQKTFNNFAGDRLIDNLFALSEGGKIALKVCRSTFRNRTFMTEF